MDTKLELIDRQEGKKQEISTKKEIKKNKKIDEIDMAILGILQSNSHTSYRKIKDRLNISIGTIHNRIEKLKSENGGPIEGYSLKLNNSNLGYEFMVIIRFDIEGRYFDDIIKELQVIPEACSIFHTTGKRSVTMICSFNSLEKIHGFIQNLYEREHISKVMSDTILNTYKNNSSVQIQGISEIKEKRGFS